MSSSVHVYQIPLLTSTKGYLATSWTADNNARQIFTARLRVLETAIPLPDGSDVSLSSEVLLEDPSTGDLFAAAPYTEPSAVEAALDSSRFFAVRVEGEGGRKAVLGVGFEERSEAMDFGIALQEARKVWGLKAANGKGAEELGGKTETVKRDLSLKQGEMIRIDLAGKVGRRDDAEDGDKGVENRALFSLVPPPQPYSEQGGGAMPLLPPPPNAQDAKKERRRSRQDVEPVAKTAAELGFDDGEFGEFQ